MIDDDDVSTNDGRKRQRYQQMTTNCKSKRSCSDDDDVVNEDLCKGGRREGNAFIRLEIEERRRDVSASEASQKKDGNERRELPFARRLEEKA